MNTIQTTQERFVEVAYPRALREAHKAFKSFHERKRGCCQQECLAKIWDQWIRLVNRGRNPEPDRRQLHFPTATITIPH